MEEILKIENNKLEQTLLIREEINNILKIFITSKYYTTYFEFDLNKKKDVEKLESIYNTVGGILNDRRHEEDL